MSGDRSATAQWDYGVVRGPSQPEKIASVSTASFPATTAPTTYGTQTSYSLQTSIAHTFQPSPLVEAISTSISASEPRTTSATHHKRGFQQPHIWNTNQTTNQTGGVAYHKIYRQQQLEFSETDQQAQWASVTLPLSTAANVSTTADRRCLCGATGTMLRECERPNISIWSRRHRSRLF